MIGLQLYSGLYLLSHLIFSKNMKQLHDARALKNIVSSILTSSAFLGFNAFTMLGGFCLTRYLSGRFYYTLCSTLPAIVGSLLAIPIERPNRRAALAIYMANIASECVYKIAVNRNVIRPLPRGDSLLFLVSISTLLYLIRSRGYGHDPVSMALRFLLGTEEAKPRAPLQSVCPHANVSCSEYVVTSAVKNFFIGLGGFGVLTSIMRPKQLMQRPSLILEKCFRRESINFGLFLGGFTGTFKLINCLLRRHREKNENWHAAVAGACAGSCSLFYPSSTIALYIFWKTAETLFNISVQRGYINRQMEIMCTLYAISVGIIFYVGVMEPSMLRGSYMKFIDRITEHRLHLINRSLLDVFDTGASIGYEEYFPDVVPSRCSHTFMETIFLWLL